jgi:hypothetical protein
MSDLEKIAALENVTIRQVRRWCADGRVPARRKKGQWHVDQQWLGRVIAREASKEVLRAYLGNGNGKQALTARDKRAFEATLLAHGIQDGRDWQKLRRDFPEKFRFLYFYYKHDPLAYRAADDPLASLRVRIELEIQRTGRVLKVKELAEKLDVSVAQLYRAEPGLIKKLKRWFLHDPAAPTEQRPAKAKPKKNLNWRHDKDDNDD